MRSTDFAIIGAGISGITFARELTRLGKSVVIVEKSRGLGGRISTRRLGDDVANQGLSTFEVTNTKLLELAKVGVKANVLTIHGNTCSPVRGINQWMKLLAEGLVILCEKHVARITRDGASWVLLDKERNRIFEATNVILTAPAPQTWEILKNSGIEIDSIREIKYGPCVRLYFKPKPDVKVPDVSLLFEEPIFDKGLYSANMRRDKVERFLESDKEVIKDEIIRTFGLYQNDFECLYVHKWKYSRALNYVSHSEQVLKDYPGVYIAGDYFSGTDLNGVIESVDYLMKQLTPA